LAWLVPTSMVIRRPRRSSRWRP